MNVHLPLPPRSHAVAASLLRLGPPARAHLLVLMVQHVRLHGTCPIGQALRPGGRHRDYPVVPAAGCEMSVLQALGGGVK